MKLLKNKHIKLLITTVIVAVVGCYFYNTLSNNLNSLNNLNIRFDLQSIVAILLFALAVIVSGVLWGKMVDVLSKKDNMKVNPIEAVEVQILSWLLKYIPGQAGSAVNKIVWAKKKGYSKKLILITFIYENIFLISASFFVGLPVIFLSGSGVDLLQNPMYLLAIIVAVSVSALAINQKTMHYIMNTLFRVVIKQPVDRSFFLTSRESYKLQAYYLIPRLINAIGFVFVVASVIDINTTAYIPLGAAYVVAGAIGIMAIFVPSGIGVREAVIVLISGQFIPVETAIVVSLLARLYSTISDGALALVYMLIKYKRKVIKS